MYEYLEGKFASVTPSYVVVDCNGVGYRVEISLSTYSAIKDKSSGRVFVRYIVREDAQVLYGFADQKEREIFSLLVSVNGIGPNTARMMLSSLSPDETVLAIADNDVKTIKAIKGIGEKTAQRVIVELKDKIDKWEYSSLPDDITPVLNNKNKEEALLALQTLGFNKTIAEKVIEKILKENPQMRVEELIKQALKKL